MSFVRKCCGSEHRSKSRILLLDLFDTNVVDILPYFVFLDRRLSGVVLEFHPLQRQWLQKLQLLGLISIAIELTKIQLEKFYFTTNVRMHIS